VSIPPENPANEPSSGKPAAKPSSRTGGGAGSADRPTGIVVISIVVLLEAFALLAAAGLYAFQLATGAPVASFWGAVFTMGLLLAFSAWLFAVGHFLFRGYRWTRAAALVAQLFVLTIGIPTITGGLPLPGLAMVLPALAAIFFLFDRKVIAFASKAGGSSGAI
jgi:hypothetical protein